MALDGGDPACIDGDELLDELEELVGVEGWERYATGGDFHAFHVEVGPKKTGLAIGSRICL